MSKGKFGRFNSVTEAIAQAEGAGIDLDSIPKQLSPDRSGNKFLKDINGRIQSYKLYMLLGIIQLEFCIKDQGQKVLCVLKQ